MKSEAVKGEAAKRTKQQDTSTAEDLEANVTGEALARAELPTGTEGLRRALVLDGKGAARKLNDWAALERWRPEDGELWVDMHPDAPGVTTWLRERSGLSPEQFEELYHCEFRSCFRSLKDDRFALSLRGYDPTLGSVSGELTHVRGWYEPRRVLSLYDYDDQSGADLERSLLEGRGPRDIPALVASFPSQVSATLLDAAKDIEESMADLEYEAHASPDWTEAIRDIQVCIARLRRQGAPINAVIRRGLEMGDTWLIRSEVETWNTAFEHMQDADDLLQTLHDRSLTIHRYVGERLAVRINSVLVVLTLVSTIVLPLTLIAGILGMHVGVPTESYPGLESPIAFFVVVGIMIVFAIIQYLVMKRRKLLTQ